MKGKCFALRFTAYFLLVVTLLSCKDKFNPKKEIFTNCANGIEPVKKVLFIGWDGVRSDALLDASTPNLNNLLGQSFYSWHVDRGPFTVSTPGWSSILHGVWPEKHGLTENSFKGNHYKRYPDIFTIIRKHRQNNGLATLSNWDGFLQITENEDYAQRFNTDKDMTSDAIRIIKECGPDVLLLHYDFPDDTGHKFGFSPQTYEYLQSIETTDNYLGQVMAAINEREATLNEKWMVVLTTDHGGEGKGHGGQDDLEQTRYVWYVVRTPLFNNSQPFDFGQTTDLLPTMLKWLGIPWTHLQLDGSPVY